MLFFLRVTAIALLILGACKKDDKKADNKTSAAASSSGSATPAAAAKEAEPSSEDSSDDKYAKPILTDDKMQRYIKSLGEGKNPFAILGAVVGPDSSLSKAQDVMKEQEAFAKKYGFSGQEEYLEITGRIMLGQTVIGTESLTASARDMITKNIADQEKAIADPATPAETKTELQQSVKEQKEQLADMDKNKNGGLNDQDLALIKKYNTELEAAQKANAAMQKK